jgi:hypothetical protein
MPSDTRCIELAPEFAKGYSRKGTLQVCVCVCCVCVCVCCVYVCVCVSAACGSTHGTKR